VATITIGREKKIEKGVTKKKQNNSDNKIILCFSERKIGKAK